VAEEEKIEILSTDDARLKLLGELLSSETSRTILNTILDHEMTALGIAQKTALSLELVRYHLKKMTEYGLVQITKVEKNSKEQDMKYYKSIRFTIMVFPPNVTEIAKKSKSLQNSIKRIYRFVAIGAAALFTWFITKPTMDDGIEAPVIPTVSYTEFVSVTITLIVIILGLIIERIFSSHKNKKFSNRSRIN
jgi:DNA-binding transcriptional ArsR family regulator